MFGNVSLRFAFAGGLIALFFHVLFLWQGRVPSLHVLEVLSWIVAFFCIGRMKEGWDRRTGELENANVELQKEMEERRKVEQTLREREELFSDLFDNSRDFIQSISADGKIIYVNRTWRENPLWFSLWPGKTLASVPRLRPQLSLRSPGLTRGGQ